MERELTPEQDSYVRRAVERGRVRDPREALREALKLWMLREESETTDDPFQTFDEWNGDADRKAYAGL